MVFACLGRCSLCCTCRSSRCTRHSRLVGGGIPATFPVGQLRGYHVFRGSFEGLYDYDLVQYRRVYNAELLNESFVVQVVPPHALAALLVKTQLLGIIRHLHIWNLRWYPAGELRARLSELCCSVGCTFVEVEFQYAFASVVNPFRLSHFFFQILQV